MKITLIVGEMIPVIGYGGTGRQVQWLARELVRRGHRVTIIAPAGSSHQACEVRGVRKASEVAGLVPPDSDIVHRHGWFDADMPFKILNTGHSGSRTVNCERGNWNFVSRRHAESHGRVTFVYNGFPVDEYHLSPKTDRLLFLAGFARPDKGLARAMDLAERFDFKLDLAGGRRVDMLARSTNRRNRLFLKSFSSRYRIHGSVDGPVKVKLLGSARAFLNPISIEEAFGMAPVEAMLCGTPVLSTPWGALPETVSAESGRLFETDDQFAEALEEVAALKSENIRQYAADRFPISATAAGYLELYQRVIDGEPLA